MNGAQALIGTLLRGGVTTCFTNPGTSEMHFVAALDSVPEMKAVLARFEGVATGAADRVANAEELVYAIERAVAEPGPHLIEARTDGAYSSPVAGDGLRAQGTGRSSRPTRRKGQGPPLPMNALARAR